MEQANDSVATDTQETVDESGEVEQATPEYVTKEDFTALANDIASLKRSMKKAVKSSDGKETQKNQTDDVDLSQKLEKLVLKQAGIAKDSEIELARKLQAETGKDIEDLLDSKYFQTELEALRTDEANAEASSGVKGDKTGGSSSKQSAEYWIAKGDYPTREQVPDPKVRRAVRDAMVSKQKSGGGKFYNEV